MRQNRITSEMEDKFSFRAEEVIDVWTGIWADRSQITASLPPNGGFSEKGWELMGKLKIE